MLFVDRVGCLEVTIMKHAAALMPLSAVHEAALELAVHISEATDEASIASLMKNLPSRFEREFERHLQLEESTLLRELEEAGEAELVQRALAEHRDLRDLLAQVASGNRDSLTLFWIALHAHVRFEERELFRIAERVLPGAFLDRPLLSAAPDPTRS